jgi:hypothetical protein
MYTMFNIIVFCLSFALAGYSAIAIQFHEFGWATGLGLMALLVTNHFTKR